MSIFPLNAIGVVFFIPFPQTDIIIDAYPPSAAYMAQWTGLSLVQVMICRLFGAKPLHEPMLINSS